ncbi:unnamed protein product, partial [Owenia fusiformis]
LVVYITCIIVIFEESKFAAKAQTENSDGSISKSTGDENPNTTLAEIENSRITVAIDADIITPIVVTPNSVSTTETTTKETSAIRGKIEHNNTSENVQETTNTDIIEDINKGANDEVESIDTSSQWPTEDNLTVPCTSEEWQPDVPECLSSHNLTSGRYTCNNRCGIQGISSIDDDIREDSVCSCHPVCMITKNCCEDFEIVCPHLHEEGAENMQLLLQTGHPKHHCTHVYGDLYTLNSFWMVDSCPDDYPYDNTRSKCENDVNEFTEMVPVTSQLTGVTYKNYFCAKCSKANNLKQWDFEVACSENVTKASIDSPKTLLGYIETFECVVKYSGQFNRCFHLISSCGDNELECVGKYVDMCENGPQSPVFNSKIFFNVYRNMYCYICRSPLEYDSTELSCDSISPDIRGCSKKRKKRSLDCQGNLAKFSFGILVDFVPTDGCTDVGSKCNTISRKLGCNLNDTDVTCISFCLNGYIYVDGLCVSESNETDCPRKPSNSSAENMHQNETIPRLSKPDSGLMKDAPILIGNITYVCVNETEPETITLRKFDDTMGLVSIICSALSLICLFIRLILQPFVPLFQNFPGKLQFSLVLSLFLASLFFLIGPNCTHIKELCVTLGVLIHWSYLVAFTWTVLISRDMFFMFRPSSFAKSSDSSGLRFLVYSLIAWGIPLVIIAIALGLDFSDINPVFKPMYGKGSDFCWISQRYPLIIFFLAPIGVTLVTNFGFFIPTAISLWRSMSERAKTMNKETEYPFGIYVKLFCLMGLTWIFAFIASFHTVLWYVFIVLNASQGVYIFIAFVVRRPIWLNLWNKKVLGTTKTTSHSDSCDTTLTNTNDSIHVAMGQPDLKTDPIKRNKQVHNKNVSSKNEGVEAEPDKGSSNKHVIDNVNITVETNTENYENVYSGTRL